MYRQTRLAVDAASTQACVHDVESPSLRSPRLSRRTRSRTILQGLRRDQAAQALQEVGQGPRPHLQGLRQPAFPRTLLRGAAEHPSRFTGNFTFLDEFEG